MSALGEGKLLAAAADATALAARLKEHLSRHVVGQAAAVEQLLVTLLAGGHGLLVGAPGLAKTLLVRSLAEALLVPFRRIQFTPDLMPADLLGGDIIDGSQAGGTTLRFVAGPVFASLVLADEINRTPPKTQAALLECMQEGAITLGGQRHALPRPFHVFATQNPLEQEGTYPLPEAQLDRFLLHIAVDYPSAAEEHAMAGRYIGAELSGDVSGPPPAPALTPDHLLAAQQLVRSLPVPPSLVQAAVDWVRSTRPGADDAAPEVRRLVQFGAGPRATQGLLRASQARAIVHGRTAVVAEDLRALAKPVLRHRLLLSAEGHVEAEGQPIAAIDQLIAALTPPSIRD